MRQSAARAAPFPLSPSISLGLHYFSLAHSFFHYFSTTVTFLFSTILSSSLCLSLLTAVSASHFHIHTFILCNIFYTAPAERRSFARAHGNISSCTILLPIFSWCLLSPQSLLYKPHSCCVTHEGCFLFLKSTYKFTNLHHLSISFFIFHYEKLPYYFPFSFA